MKSMGSKLGPMVAMVQGKQPYDAAQAKAAATELQALAAQDWAPLFPEGSDADTLGRGKAKPEIWANMDDFVAKHAALTEGATVLAAVAGDGLEALKANIGKVGGSCGSCHETYRR